MIIDAPSNLTPCFPPTHVYLLGESWWWISIYSCPWSANNCPTPCWFSHPFTPHRSSYNIYIDDINNTSHPHLAHLVPPSPLLVTDQVRVPDNIYCTGNINRIQNKGNRWTKTIIEFNWYACNSFCYFGYTVLLRIHQVDELVVYGWMLFCVSWSEGAPVLIISTVLQWLFQECYMSKHM
jgi:hypothetical protein